MIAPKPSNDCCLAVLDEVEREMDDNSFDFEEAGVIAYETITHIRKRLKGE